MILLIAFLLAVAGVTYTVDFATIGRIAEGDERALRAVYDALSTRAMGIALRILGDRNAAEDVVQETFVEVWKRAREYDAKRGGVAGWVITIARSRAIDRKRSKTSAARVMRDVSREPETPGPTPGHLVEQSQTKERVHAALAALSEEQRVVLEMAYFEGLSQSEIAERTELPLGTVKTRTRLAMDKLAGMLVDGGTAV